MPETPQLIIPTVIPEPDLPRRTEPVLPKTAGPEPEYTLTNASDPTAGAGRAIPPAEVGGNPAVVPAEALN